MNEQASIDPRGQAEIVELAADIVSAYVSKNPIGASDLPKLISEVHASLRNLTTTEVAEEPIELKPAVSIKKSVTPDFIICLEDGKKFKSLKRHLSSTFGMTPEQYREKWNLPPDYPMVAPNYSAIRSGLARSNGLGRKPAAVPKAKPSRRVKAVQVAAE